MDAEPIAAILRNAEQINHCAGLDPRHKLLIQMVRELVLSHQCRDAQIAMTVDRLGGIVEGKPTCETNFLQRVDELVRLELSRQKLIQDCNSIVHHQRAKMSVAELKSKLNDAVGVATGNL